MDHGICISLSSLTLSGSTSLNSFVGTTLLLYRGLTLVRTNVFFWQVCQAILFIFNSHLLLREFVEGGLWETLLLLLWFDHLHNSFIISVASMTRITEWGLSDCSLLCGFLLWSHILLKCLLGTDITDDCWISLRDVVLSLLLRAHTTHIERLPCSILARCCWLSLIYIKS